MAKVVFVGAFAYAQEVLDAFPEPPILVVTTTMDAPRQQELSWPNESHYVGLTHDRCDIGPLVASFLPDLVVVAGWRRLVPIVAPTVGFHSAKLPEYPGRAPVANAILRGDKLLTNTMLWLDDGVDTGDIIDTRSFPIGRDPDRIYRDIGRTSATMLRVHWARLLDGTAKSYPQDMAKRGPETPAAAWRAIG